MNTNSSRFRKTKDRIKQTLRSASLSAVDFPNDVEGFVRYLFQNYHDQFANEDWLNFPHSCGVMTVAGPGGQKAYVEYQFNDWGSTPEERLKIIYQQGGKFSGVEGVPIMICFQSEAWTTNNPDYKGQVPLAEFPDKFEIIAITASTPDGRSAWGRLPVRRGENNRLLPDGEIEVFSSLNPPKGFVSVDDNMARAFFDGWIDQMTQADINMRGVNN